MAAFFLVLAVVVGVVLGDAVLANTSSGSVALFDQSITGFTQGQLLVIFGALGFLLATFLFMAWGASRGRRNRRKERRVVHRDMEGRIGELERENAGLREELERTHRTTRLGDLREPPEKTAAVAPTYSSREESRQFRPARAQTDSNFHEERTDQPERTR